ncbi:putative polyketide synthase [Xylariales sp. AK1849]|nr:putative polyketide synthase [Xylariales sp. AK1849]
MGVRLPGGIRSSSELFDFLANKGDARNIVPEDRYNVEAYYDPSGKPGSIATKYGYYLDVDLAQFDASMFRISNAELASMDPSQRLLLEVTREAFESAGEADFRGRNIGTFVGDFTEDWQDLQNVDLLNSAPYQMTGKADFALANRLAFEYDLLGPSVSIKTACSATAEAVHQAVLAIRSGSCPSAIVAGANIIITPRISIAMTQIGLLAADGNCKTFDAGANGFARGESVCALYIKRLDDAIRDGNPIRAVIRACDSNADGGDGSRTFGTPNAAAQEKLIRQTYELAGLPLAETKVVELHGTGTPVGDPLETTAIAACFGGKEKVYIGSVKPNIGHGEGGSAMASIIKSVVALESKTILPNIKFERPNPKIPWERNLAVPIEPQHWPEATRERMSINSFGLGGSNVHIVLDSAASMGVPSRRWAPKHKGLLLLSANSVPAITQMAANYGQYLEKNPESLDAMVYTLASRRERLKLATYCIVDGLTVSEPAAPSESQGARHVAFIFTGQGAQWVGMGREMMNENAEFAASIRNMDEALKSLEHPPDWSLEELLVADTADKDLLNPVDRAQPICTAVQVAYVDALAVWNIRPSAVVGHSSGEIAAAYAAGVLTSGEAITTAYYRGYACARNKVPGGMAAVGMGRDKVEGYLKPGVVLACENSNASVTISGDSEALDGTIDSLKQAHPDLFVRKLRLQTAYHSHHMATIGDLYQSLITPHLAPKPPQVPYYSTVYGRQVLEGKVFGPQYWQLNLISPVLFRTAGAQMLADMPNTAHLEIGPHGALAGPLRHICKETGYLTPYAALADRGHDTSRTFLAAIGKLYCFGIKPQVSTSEQAFALPDLPSYPWNYETRHWAETRVMAGLRFRKHRKHELLGYRILESSDTEPAWRNVLRLGDVSWLADHCVETDIVFPAAGYIAIAGTTVAQLTGSTAYTVQDVNIAAAMLLTEGKGTEIVTTLRKHSLTVSKDSKWWEFSISSENNGNWTKHCWGLVTDGCGVALPPTPDVAPHTRTVDSKRWYTALSRIGLNYSNRFIGLDNITASPVEQSASASITDRQDVGEAYALHPSTLDILFQSWSVALAQGECRRLDRLFLPTFIEQLYVSDEGSHTTLRVRTTSHGRMGAAVGDSYGVVGSSQQVAFLLKGFQAAMMESALSQATPELKSMSIQWHPALDFAAPETLMRPTRDVTTDITFAEQFGLLCAAEIHEEAATVTSLAQPFFQHFLDGVANHMDQVDQGLSNIPDAQNLKALGREARREKLVEWREQSEGSPVEVIAEALWRVYYNIKDLLEGRETLIDVLLVGGMLQKFYDETNSWSDVADFFRVLGLNKPQIRVLEIGAGTGSTTSIVLAAMQSSHGEHLYGDYTVTDVSAGFVNQTKDRFSQYPNLKFAVCDITADPLEQGFEAASYDLIIAANVLHATPNLVETLTRCRTLLKPDGQIFMQEFCGRTLFLSNTTILSGKLTMYRFIDTRYADLIMGLFDGWWAGINDGRVERPVLQEDGWDTKLRQSGFHGIQSAVRDNKHPHFFNTTNILARARSDEASELVESGKSIVTLLKPSTELDDFGQKIKSALEAVGYTVDEHVWGARLPEGQDTVSLMDVDAERVPILADVGADDLAAFIDLVGEVSGQALLWLMRPAQTQCSDPQYGQMPGVARCVRAELAIDFVTLELDKLDDEASQAVARVLGKVQQAQRAASENDSLDIDSEYVWRNGQVLLSRIHTSSVDQALADAAPQTDAKHLTIGQPGMLQTMCWTGHPLPPVAPNQVQIRIKVTGLNFHDVAVAMGIVGPDGQMEKDGYHGLGSEGTAIVTAVGAGIEHVAVGDRVVFMEILTSCFATEMQLPGDLVARAPTGVSDEDAAGLIIPYATVLWSFLEKAHMKRGQTVLIHSAAGGVGIAAIYIARWIGADIYCTVGSTAKVDFLNTELGVPHDRIFHSHDDSFVADVLRATGGLGVDVVLNSLSGELLHASWKCVATGGCMVDIGKRDFLGRGRLAMNPFVGNRAFFGVDLATMIVASKYRLVPFLRQSIELFEAGEIVPLHPTTVFESDKIQDAFRYMQKGVHMGRIVVRMPEDPASLPLALPVPKPTFSPDAVYLLAGGLGGLGRSILSWMASHGARHLIVFSPSAGTRAEHHLFVEELREMGCELRCLTGDVADCDSVRGVMAAAGDRPIKGVLQLAMVLRDTGFLNMDHDGWTATTNPKIRGTMNLHQLLPKDLDFFIMCGSTGGTLGAYGQSNYAAANTYLDAFLHFRHGQGLPAAVLDIAAIGDIGYVAENKNVAGRLGRALAGFMVEAEFLRCLQLAVERSSSKYVAPIPPTPTVAFEEASQVVLYNDTALPLSDPQNTASFRRDPRLSVFRNTQGATTRGDGAGSEGLRSFLGSLVSEPERLDDASTTIFLAEQIAKRIFAFLMQEDAIINTSQTLTSMGADSLVAIEIRNWWKQTLGIEITVLELADPSNTMELLGALAVERLKEKLPSK